KRAAVFERLAINDTGDDNEQMKGALEGLAGDRMRPWFGKPADRSDWLDPNAADFRAVLRNPNERVIVWVDDRHWYTDGSYWLDPNWNGSNNEGVNSVNLNTIHNDSAELGNTR